MMMASKIDGMVFSRERHDRTLVLTHVVDSHNLDTLQMTEPLNRAFMTLVAE